MLDEPRQKMLKVVRLIARAWIDDNSPENEFNVEMRESSQQYQRAIDAVHGDLQEERALYEATVLSFFKNCENGLKSPDFPHEIYGLAGPKLEHVSHPLRQAEERYFRRKFLLPDTGDSLENWALIGMALTEKSESAVKVFLDSVAENSKRGGRPKKKISLDYERSCWKLTVNYFAITEAMESGSEAPKIYSAEELLDAYVYAFDNPEEHGYIELFQIIESKLKMKGISRSSLITSFYRGNKRREELFND